MLLRKKVIAYIDNNNLKGKDVATRCNISPGSLSSFKNGRYEPRFETIMCLAELFPDEKFDLINDSCIYINGYQNLRLAMEYAAFHKFYKVLIYLIKKQCDNEDLNKNNKDWINIYELILKYKDNPVLLSEESRKIRSHTYEMNILKDILLIRKYHYHKDFNYFLSFEFENLQSKIDKINSPLIRNYFSTRVSEYFGWINLHLNKIDEARQNFSDIIKLNIDPEGNAHAFHGLGLSYQFDDFEKSLEILKTSKNIFKRLFNQNEVDNVTRSINFLSCFWGNYNSYVMLNKKEEDKHEIALIESSKGNFETAKTIIDGLHFDCDNKDENKIAFHLYYKGIICHDRSSLLRSIMLFRKCNDRFYIRLPCLELLSMGEDIEMVNALYGEEILEKQLVNIN